MDWLKTESKELVQGSSEWHEFRSRHIGASEVPIVMGASPYKNPYQLWLDKTGQVPEIEKFKGNFATEKGHRLEPIARDMYNKKYNCNMIPEVKEHDTIKFISASYDGIDHSIKRVIEIKFAGKIDHQGAMLGKVPEKYMHQVQTQLLVSGYNELDYVSFDEQDIAVVRVLPDLEIQKKIIEKVSEFWNLVQTNTPPPTDEIQIEDKILESLLYSREKRKAEIDALTISFDMIVDEIKKLFKQDVGTCAGYKLSWSDVKGSVEYKNIPELKDVDLEKYRKPAIKRFNITKEKK